MQLHAHQPHPPRNVVGYLQHLSHCTPASSKHRYVKFAPRRKGVSRGFQLVDGCISEEMTSLQLVLLFTVLFSATLCPSSLGKDNAASQPCSVVVIDAEIEVQLSPSPTRWSTLNPRLLNAVVGSSFLSLEHVLVVETSPFMPELLDPVYMAHKFVCFAALVFLLCTAAAVVCLSVFCVCSYYVSTINPLYVPSWSLEEFFPYSSRHQKPQGTYLK